MIKRVLVLSGVLAVISFVLGYLYINQDHRDIEKEKAVYVLEAKELAKEYVLDDKMASEKYLNKTLQIIGEVTDIETNALTLDGVVYATFEKDFETSKTKLGEKINIKGRCIGFDELLEIVKLDQISVID